MESFVKITEFDIKINKDTAFQLIDLYPGNPVYDEVLIEYDEIERKVMEAIHPVAYFKIGKLFDEIAGYIEENDQCSIDNPVVYVLMTLGDEVNDLSNHYFKEGDYLLGLLINAMSDAYLFQVDDMLRDRITEFCKTKRYGIAKRLDAPINLPMNVQKDILDEIKREEPLSIHVTEGFMYTTIKTMGYLILLTSEEKGISYEGHNCSSCSVKNCKLRKAE